MNFDERCDCEGDQKNTYIVERFGKRFRNVLIAHVAFSSNVSTRCETCTCGC